MDAGSSSSLELPQQFRQFTISEIHLATRNFDESLVIGRGGFGRVYKGTIFTNGSTSLVVAIKRLDSTSNQGAAEFWAEIHMLSKLRHCHLVSLMGYCNDGQEMILVYEYMPHGTLEDRLHKLRSPLLWVRRLKICIGAARGLDYLHTDDNWAAKISDFGLSKVGPINQSVTYVNTLVKGTYGYLDPDYHATGRLTRKSDVYAFGVVLFEVLSGKRAVDQSLDEEHWGWGLVSWAQESMKEGRLKEIVDDCIRERILPKCLKKFAGVANQCLHSNPKQRPTMAEIVVSLESILALQKRASNTLHPEGMAIFGNGFLLGAEGKRLKSLKLFFDTVGGEDRLLHRFDYEAISVATENFSENNRIRYIPPCKSFAFKGRLPNGQGVSIARHESTSYYQEFKNEASLMVKLEHENLMQLLGYSIEGTQVFLVYEFAVCTSLYGLLFDRECTLLDWNKHKKIILAVASVLLYLHQHDVIHGNVTHENILLDEGLDLIKLSDFALARCLPINEADHVRVYPLTWISGYIAPEVLQYNLLSTKADVYSLGGLILETITGCRGIRDIWTNWLEGTCSNIKDPRIDADSSSFTRLIHIGLLCVQLDAAERPTMEEVVSMLTNRSSLITLPIPKRSLKIVTPLADDDYDSEAVEDLMSDCDSGTVEDFMSDCDFWDSLGFHV